MIKFNNRPDNATIPTTLILTGLLFVSLAVGVTISRSDNLGWLLLPVGAVGMVVGYYVFVAKPRLGILVFLVELIWGGNGRWLELMGGAISPRYLIISACILGYFFQLAIKRRHLPSPKFITPLILFYLMIFSGITIGLANRNPSFLQDAQVWLYLLAAIMILDLWNKDGPPYGLLRLLLLNSAGIAVFQLALTLIINIRLDFVWSIQPLLERMRILITHLPGTQIWYVFMGNSLLYGYIIAICILLATESRKTHFILSKHILWLMAGLAFLAAIFSMTRGTWGQVFLTLVLVGCDLLVRGRIKFRVGIVVAILFLVPFASVISIPEWHDAFGMRVGTLLPSNVDSLDSYDSIIVKQIEAQKMNASIARSPFLGYGFGYVQVDNGLGSIYFHNSYLQFALKTGVIGLGILFYLFLYAIWRAWMVGRRVQHRFPQDRNILYGMIYGFLGVLVATSSNPHMTTPIFVAMLAFMLAFTELVDRRWQQDRLVDGRRGIR